MTKTDYISTEQFKEGFKNDDTQLRVGVLSAIKVRTRLSQYVSPGLRGEFVRMCFLKTTREVC